MLCSPPLWGSPARNLQEPCAAQWVRHQAAARRCGIYEGPPVQDSQKDRLKYEDIAQVRPSRS